MPIKPHPLPETALLQTYAQNPACYTDCYVTEISGEALLSDYIAAFYTTKLFKLERLILKVVARIPSSDQDALDLANAETTKFAAWNVEERTVDQILLCDFLQNTRSWLHVASTDAGTRLYFGSGVTPTNDVQLGVIFRVLLPFHKIYARALLSAAKRRLSKQSL